MFVSVQAFAQKYTADKAKNYIQSSNYKDMCRFVYTPYLKMAGEKILLDGYAYCLFERVRGQALNAKTICGVYSINLMDGELDYFIPGSETSEFYRNGKCSEEVYEELFGNGDEYGIVSRLSIMMQVAGSGYEVLLDKIGYSNKLKEKIDTFYKKQREEVLKQEKEYQKKQKAKEIKEVKKVKKQKKENKKLNQLFE